MCCYNFLAEEIFPKNFVFKIFFLPVIHNKEAESNRKLFKTINPFLYIANIVVCERTTVNFGDLYPSILIYRTSLLI